MKWIIGLIIAGLIGLNIFQYYNPQINDKIVERIDTITLTKTLLKTIIKPKFDTIVYIDTIVKFQNDSDCFAEYCKLLRKFLARKTYNDSIISDNDTVSYSAFISKNTLDSLKIMSQAKTVFITKTIVENKSRLYGGLIVGKDNISPTIMFKKNKFEYLANYNFYNKSFNIGLLYEIK